MSKAQEDKQQAAFRAVLDKLLQEPENKFCADCRAAGARWASPKLGIFICMKCAGIHRGLGVHISFVRSVTLDKWKESEVQDMIGGNSRAAAIYEATLPENYPRPSDSIALEKFIRNKYQDKKFMGAAPPKQQPSVQTVSTPVSRPTPQPEQSPPARRVVQPRQPTVVAKPAPAPVAQSPLIGDLNAIQAASTPPTVDLGLVPSGGAPQQQISQQQAAKNDILSLLAQPAQPTQPQYYAPQPVFPMATPGYPMAAGFQYPAYYQQQPQVLPTTGWGYAPVQPDAGGLDILNKIHNIGQENRGNSPGLSQVYF